MSKSSDAVIKRSLKVLVADDDPFMQRTTIAMLKSLGHSGVVVDDGQKMLDCLESLEFDVVLMDIMMPRMDGLRALALLREREHRRGGHQAVIIATAHNEPGDVEKLIEAGADACVPKPIDLKKLREQLLRVVGPG